ncbi:hypothetical protein SISNIDRAFT_468367 [Sistotremastrum niveocremeum HHB9708]|uniref:Uncharacterized protein n=1 Tax=Sistotremastrum niveocremeum HHB9708 TaxID=1314777 RepID=A0A164RIH9_9AGAM|nr:hypothetical protein SISNIDRAFT_468367 [Sistotremastrum niveocremeum HHB9708]
MAAPLPWLCTPESDSDSAHKSQAHERRRRVDINDKPVTNDGRLKEVSKSQSLAQRLHDQFWGTQYSGQATAGLDAVELKKRESVLRDHTLDPPIRPRLSESLSAYIILAIVMLASLYLCLSHVPTTIILELRFSQPCHTSLHENSLETAVQQTSGYCPCSNHLTIEHLCYLQPRFHVEGLLPPLCRI